MDDRFLGTAHPHFFGQEFASNRGLSCTLEHNFRRELLIIQKTMLPEPFHNPGDIGFAIIRQLSANLRRKAIASPKSQ